MILNTEVGAQPFPLCCFSTTNGFLAASIAALQQPSRSIDTLHFFVDATRTFIYTYTRIFPWDTSQMHEGLIQIRSTSCKKKGAKPFSPCHFPNLKWFLGRLYLTHWENIHVATSLCNFPQWQIKVWKLNPAALIQITLGIKVPSGDLQNTSAKVLMVCVCAYMDFVNA